MEFLFLSCNVLYMISSIVLQVLEKGKMLASWNFTVESSVSSRLPYTVRNGSWLVFSLNWCSVEDSV